MAVSHRTSRLPVVAQILAIVLAVPVLTLFPPAHGRMILIPTDRGHAAKLIPDALASGALLVQRGPLRGSIVVDGDRVRLARAMLAGGTLVLAAPFAGCGSAA